MLAAFSGADPTLWIATVAWFASESALRPVCRKRFGDELTDGYPRWRVALGCWTQLICIPMLFFAFVFARQEWIMECFLLVFGGSLLQDVLRFPTTMGTMLILHHAACLVGMAVARLAPGPDWPHLFPFFFCGCTALEIGSGTCNLYWLQLLSPRQRSLLYQMAMNVSNLVAIACVCLWASSPLAPTVARYFSVAAIMVLVYERQKEMQRVCRVTWAHPFGVDGPSD